MLIYYLYTNISTEIAFIVSVIEINYSLGNGRLWFLNNLKANLGSNLELIVPNKYEVIILILASFMVIYMFICLFYRLSSIWGFVGAYGPKRYNSK